MVHQLKAQQTLIDILDKEVIEAHNKASDLFETAITKKEDKYYNLYYIFKNNTFKPICSKFNSEKSKLREMIFQSDIETLKAQRIHLDNLFDTDWDYHKKHRSLRKQENKDKYEQEVLDPHSDLMEKEEEKLRQMIINL